MEWAMRMLKYEVDVHGDPTFGFDALRTHELWSSWLDEISISGVSAAVLEARLPDIMRELRIAGISLDFRETIAGRLFTQYRVGGQFADRGRVMDNLLAHQQHIRQLRRIGLTR